MKRLQLADLRFAISLLILLPAWFTVWWFHHSQPHVLLGTNLITGVMGYWIGSSKGSQEKDAVIAQLPPSAPEGHCCRGEEPHDHPKKAM
jgi:hypothetical protein